uniref:V(D)J recombination activating protein 1 n=1 Tax=Lygus hesperus TaxID=30085 RepID=A0A0A9X1G7_LYGHE
MFFIDFKTNRDKCEAVGGVLLEEGDCIQLWKKTRCHRRSPSKRAASCQLIFLPEVRTADGQGEDLLTCRASHGFLNSCPMSSVKSRVSTCDPLATNSKTCDTTNYLKTQCAFMQTCDHAMLISGGWNRQMAEEEALKNLRVVNKMLLKNGFLPNNIKTFYANGFVDDDELGDVYPSGLKLALRYHLRTLCETARCADSLVLYLNSPTRPDGASLLWDRDSNGEADETEVYTMKELLRDIDGCKAKRVVVLADQSFSEELVRLSMKYSTNLRNLIALGVGPTDAKQTMVTLLGKVNPGTCLSELVSQSSDVKYAGAMEDILNGTLSGGPCSADFHPERYFGCQNLSTLEMLEPDQVPDNEERRR